MSPTCNLMLLDPVLVRTPWKLRQGKQRAVGAVDVVVEEEPEALTGSWWRSTWVAPPLMLSVVVAGRRARRVCSGEPMRMYTKPEDDRVDELFTPVILMLAGDRSQR